MSPVEDHQVAADRGSTAPEYFALDGREELPAVRGRVVALDSIALVAEPV